MILDSTYLMPLVKIEVSTDLLLAVAENRIKEDKLSFDLVTVNSVSLFELQTKAANQNFFGHRCNRSDFETI